MTTEQKDALLKEATERYPSGCSYICLNSDGSDSNVFKEVTIRKPFWWGSREIAVAEGKGLVYVDGVWAKRTDIKEESTNYPIF